MLKTLYPEEKANTNLRAGLITINLQVDKSCGPEHIAQIDSLSSSIRCTYYAPNSENIGSAEVSLLNHLKKWATEESLVEVVENFPDTVQFLSADSAKQKDKLIQSKVTLHHQGKVVLLKTETINYITADNNYTLVCTDLQKYYTSKSLKTWDKLLCPSGSFIRANKSTIVNKNYCKHYVKGKPVALILKNEEKVILSRRRQTFVIKNLRGK